MKLSQFISTLTSTDVQMKLLDMESGAEIATMKVSGYASLDNTIENREVKQWAINSTTSITITLGDVIV